MAEKLGYNWSMRTHNQRTGTLGESIALRYLENKGHSLLARNYRTEHGELDLIMQKNNRTVFVEVKTRRSDRFGQPEAAITNRKQEILVACAEAYFAENPPYPEDWQIDVIAIRLFLGKPPQITHIENAVPG